jgi:hypothetical protein
MRRIRRIVGLALAQGLVLVGAAGAWDLRGDAPREDFEAFHRRFTSDVYFYPRHGAHPLGWTGFEVWVDTSVDPGFGDEGFAATAIDGDLPGDALAVARVGARKGLPGGFDLGLAYGRALGGDLELVSGELGWALIRGGAVTPALGLRATVTRTLDAGSYDLDQYGLELLASKGFTVMTLFGGAGVVRSESTLDRGFDGGPAGRFTETTTRNVVFAGVTLKLLIPRLTISLEQGEELQGAVRVGFGF